MYPLKLVMPSYKKQGIETAKIGVVLPTEVKQRLERVAIDKSWSISQTAATAIEGWLDQYEETTQTGEDAA